MPGGHKSNPTAEKIRIKGRGAACIGLISGGLPFYCFLFCHPQQVINMGVFIVFLILLYLSTPTCGLLAARTAQVEQTMFWTCWWNFSHYCSAYSLVSEKDKRKRLGENVIEAEFPRCKDRQTLTNLQKTPSTICETASCNVRTSAKTLNN